jgi:hypothetical protein
MASIVFSLRLRGPTDMMGLGVMHSGACDTRLRARRLRWNADWKDGIGESGVEETEAEEEGGEDEDGETDEDGEVETDENEDEVMEN